MTNLTELKRFINEPHCDLGPNAWRLAELVKPMKNARFLDLGVRLGPSSALMSIDAKEKNNKVCGCDVNFDGFQSTGARFVNDDYMCYLYDSATLGKVWDEEPFDVIFVDTLHTREFVLAELYFWADHLKEEGYFIFHDTHLVNRGDYVIGDRAWATPDEAVTDYFNLPSELCKGPLHESITTDEYEDDDIELKHYTESYGMTFVKVKTLDAIERFKSGIDWKDVFEQRNWLVDLHLNDKRSDCVGREWGLDLKNITAEMIINV